MLNAYWEALRFELPPAGDTGSDAWRRCLDTALPTPEDIIPWEKAPCVAGPSYLVQPRSIAVLMVPAAGRGS
jgi:glycogen operon protein